ncbi:hypothetical protein C7S13_5616 [Burkholderia cepacia]|nr:hypothetical protein [Burkholderia cepacia]
MPRRRPFGSDRQVRLQADVLRARAARPCAMQKKPPNESGAQGCRRGAATGPCACVRLR